MAVSELELGHKAEDCAWLEIVATAGATQCSDVVIVLAEHVVAGNSEAQAEVELCSSAAKNLSMSMILMTVLNKEAK